MRFRALISRSASAVRPHSLRRTLLLSGVLSVLATTAFTATPEVVQITSADGFTLGGTYTAGAAQGPAVLLLHQCNGDRSGYESLATKLGEAGVHTLTMDFRGIGDSRGENGTVSFRRQGQKLWPSFEADVDAAMAFLTAREGVDVDRIGLLGASCGGTQCVYQARKRDDIRAVVFFSTSLPWLAERDVEEFAGGQTIPMLCIAAQDDVAANQVATLVFQRSSSPDTRLLLYKGNEHGTPLFAQDPTLEDTIVSWFEQYLR